MFKQVYMNLLESRSHLPILNIQNTVTSMLTQF